ncbi:MAG TPA: flippase [Chloroflexia bacterium]|nr:flippase [Chloroflexia bacterium]
MVEQESPEVSLHEPPAAQHAARRVAVNAANPFVAQIATKVLMLGYTFLQFRLLGGQQAAPLADYFLAGIILLYTSTISDWGLSTLLTREVAKSEGTQERQTEELFRRTLGLRLLISLALFVPVGLFVAAYLALSSLSVAGAWTVLLLTLSLLPGAFSGSVTALLYARERMSLPAAIGVATSVVNVALGVGTLLLGWGIVGLALAALTSTLVTAIIFYRILRRDFPTLHIGADFSGARLRDNASITLLKAGMPLMLNALLVGLFFRVDMLIIRPALGSFAAEQYQAAYGFLNFVLLITPAVTLALFPRMARHAQSDRPRLALEYTFALKVLLILSVPIIALTVWFAPLLISVVTGLTTKYLPEGAVALQILIFFLPLSFINGVTQYVLIALNLQRLITRAFVATVVVNLAANLALVPLIGIYGAALATILSELILLGPFLLWTGREIGTVPLPSLAIKPILAGAVVVVLTWILWPLMGRWSNSLGDFLLYMGSGLFLLLLYAGTMLALRPFTQDEVRGLKNALRRR